MKKILTIVALVLLATACNKASTQKNSSNNSSNSSSNASKNSPIGGVSTGSNPNASTPGLTVTPTDLTLKNEMFGDNTTTRLTIGTEASQVQMECSGGTIGVPFKVDSNGNFSLQGQYTPAGPPLAATIVNGVLTQPDYSATYSGTVSGDGKTIHLVITPKNTNIKSVSVDLQFGKGDIDRMACSM
jgi:ABC-type Fe3+-hydroxamate transport system substrate-binding protein